MLRKFVIFAISVSLLLVLTNCVGTSLPVTSKMNSISPQPPKAKPVSLTISAAASLREALEEIQKIYQHENLNVKLTFNFGSSGSLQQQIEQGAPVDMFISAAPKQMDALQGKGLIINDTRRELLKNKVVLIAPVNSSKVTGFASLAGDDVKLLALGEPAGVPAGKYAKEVLASFKVWDSLKSKVVYAKDVRQVLSYVETENVDAGIVYLTDAKVSEKVKIVATALAETHSPVVYPLALIKGCKDVESAKDFAEFLTSPQAAQVFAKYGFVTLNK